MLAKHAAAVGKHNKDMASYLPLGDEYEDNDKTHVHGRPPLLTRAVGSGERHTAHSGQENLDGLVFNDTFGILMPSPLGEGYCTQGDAREVIQEETRLRVGHANDCLHSIRATMQQRIHLGPDLTANSQAMTSRQKSVRNRLQDVLNIMADAYCHTHT